MPRRPMHRTAILVCGYRRNFENMAQAHVLITGINGYIGRYLLNDKPSPIRLSGTVRAPLDQSRIGLPETLPVYPLNLEDDMDSTLSRVEPDIIIHTAALANLAMCEKNPVLAATVNTRATAALARWCAQRHIRLVYLSTDIVFSGKEPPYAESDEPNPINVYGYSKWQGEVAVLSQLNDAVVLRIALALGCGSGGRRNFIDWFLDKINRHETIPLFQDEVRTPTAVSSVAETIWQIALCKETGIMHLCGQERINRLELGQLLCNHLGYGHELLRPVSVHSMTDYPRPLDVSLVSTCRLKGQPLLIPGISQMLDAIIPKNT